MTYLLNVGSRELLLRDGFELLARLRDQRSAWPCIAFEPKGELGRDRSDQHALARLQLAWALEQQAQERDAELVRFALAEEVKWREEDPWQGLGEALEILASLAARQQSVENVWVMARAKRANFDAACGFSIEHAFAAGVAETLAHVRHSAHPEREEVLALLTADGEGPAVDEDDVADWLSSTPRGLPAEPRENALVWFDRALLLKRRDVARAFLDEWSEERERGADTLSSLAYRLEELECWREASAARKQLFQHQEDSWGRASEACNIAHAERLGGDCQEALRWLELAAQLHAEHAKWRETGLARSFVEECFRCAAAAGFENGGPAFTLAESFAQVTPRLPLEAFRAAVAAARVVKSPRAPHYEQLRDEEERRAAQERSRIFGDSD